jgi:hypothetical protein
MCPPLAGDALVDGTLIMPRQEHSSAGDLSAAAAGTAARVVDWVVDVGDRVTVSVGHGLIGDPST